LDTVIRDEVFTRQKFVNKDVDLKFSNNLNSICRRMSKKLEVEDDDVEDWWESTREHTHKILKMHRNNTIKGLKNCFKVSPRDRNCEHGGEPLLTQIGTQKE
jgi:hypothetical protein